MLYICEELSLPQKKKKRKITLRDCAQRESSAYFYMWKIYRHLPSIFKNFPMSEENLFLLFRLSPIFSLYNEFSFM